MMAVFVADARNNFTNDSAFGRNLTQGFYNNGTRGGGIFNNTYVGGSRNYSANNRRGYNWR